MNVHYLQHVPFEGLGSIETYLQVQGHQLTVSRLYASTELPSLDDFDWLIVMGGPMSVHDTDTYPWLSPEKAFIRETIARGKIVLGICLGAQLIAQALGAAVRANPVREIGWFPVERSPDLKPASLAQLFPPTFDAFHWHGETFDLPPATAPIGSSEACTNQGFVKGDRIIALQCHLETTPSNAQSLIDHCRDELDHSRFVQSESEMMAGPGRFVAINQLMISILRYCEALKKSNGFHC